MARGAFWLGLVLPALAPFVCPFPPFQDWPAHVGVVGALAHMDEPAARIGDFYTYSGWFKLNMLFYLPAWGLTALMPPIAAANLCLAVAMGALGPSVWYLCRAVDADSRLALLATPLAIGRHVYCGFGPNAAALPLFVLVFAFFFWARRSGRGPDATANGAMSWIGATAGLVATLTALAFMHAFIYLAAAGLLALVVVGDIARSPRRAAVAGASALIASGFLFVVLYRQGLGVAGQPPTEGSRVAQAIWQAIVSAPRGRLGETFWQWLFASYRYQRLDDLCQIAWAAGLIGAAALGAVLDGRDAWRSGRVALFGLAMVTVVMFCVLPENVGPPVNWWGARLRLPVLAALLCLPLMGRAVGAQAGVFVAVLGGLSTATVGLAVYDLSKFHRAYGAGLGEVLDAMPPGQTISALHFTPRAVNEYPGQPFGYFGNYYLAHRGGATPHDFFERRELPFRRQRTLPSPPWGIASAFRWAQHSPGFDGFLLKTDARKGNAPFFGDASKVELVKDTGAWRYYRVRAPPAAP